MSDAKRGTPDGRIVPTGGSGTAPARTTRTANPELQVMSRMDRLLAELPDDAARARAVAWLVGYHGPKPAPEPIAPFQPGDPRQ